MVAHRYPRRDRNPPARFTINALPRSRSVDEPGVREAVDANKAEGWHLAMSLDTEALKQLNCWKEVNRPTDAKVLHTKFVLKLKINESGIIDRYKARLVACENDKRTRRKMTAFHLSPTIL